MLLHITKGEYMKLKSAALILLFLFSLLSNFSSGEEIHPAPLFDAITVDDKLFSLNESKGNVTILHIQNFESPICIECEKELREQIIELSQLAKMDQHNITIVTLNMRKNPSSENGKVLAERWYGINVTWYWIEEFQPYEIANLYSKYWTVDGAFANPTIILINQSLHIVGVYHIYCMGKGELDGVQKAESLSEYAEKIVRGEWTEFKGKTNGKEITFISMFILGIITALSPCSIALLVSMISYVGATKGSGGTKGEAIQGFKIGLVFTVGMALVFFLIGLLISSIGIFIEASPLFYFVAGLILLLLGINIFKPLKEMIHLYPKKEEGIVEKGGRWFEKISKKSLLLGAFFLGILFAVGWAPCAISLVMPVFILVLAQKTTLLMGGLLLFIFGIGHGVPIIPLTTFTKAMRAKIGNVYIKAGRIVEKIFALAIIIIAIIFMLRYFGINLW